MFQDGVWVSREVDSLRWATDLEIVVISKTGWLEMQEVNVSDTCWSERLTWCPQILSIPILPICYY